MSESEPTDAATGDETPAAATPRPARWGRSRRVIIEWVVIIVVAVAASLVVRAYVFQTFSIPSGSMEPTLHVGDRIVVDKLSVEFGTIHTGDIIVFRALPKVASVCSDAVPDLVKRVVGVPGDHLTSRGNAIYVNGKRLDERWTHFEPLGGAIGHVTVPPGDYFVMGDNHSNSCDSRMWGMVPHANIIGKVFLRIWPPSRIKWF